MFKLEKFEVKKYFYKSYYYYVKIIWSIKIVEIWLFIYKNVYW